jgi:hypothetical protein
MRQDVLVKFPSFNIVHAILAVREGILSFNFSSLIAELLEPLLVFAPVGIVCQDLVLCCFDKLVLSLEWQS